jgi:hypothetical protein
MTQAQAYAEKDVSISKKLLLSHLGNIVQWNKIRRLGSAFRQPLVALSKVGAVRITVFGPTRIRLLPYPFWQHKSPLPRCQHAETIVTAIALAVQQTKASFLSGPV